MRAYTLHLHSNQTVREMVAWCSQDSIQYWIYSAPLTSAYNWTENPRYSVLTSFRKWLIQLCICSDEGYIFTPQEGEHYGGTWDDNAHVNLDHSSA